MRHVYFRTDASTSIGMGHVMRCLTLADGLRESGYSAHFMCREHTGNLCNLIVARGFTVTRLKAGPTQSVEGLPAHEQWLGAPWQQDAEQTRHAIGGARPEWLIVDHYGVDRRWEAMLRPAVARIMAIDDMADRIHDCDLLLDQNLAPNMQQRYVDKVPARCATMLGPMYALLQPIYRQLRRDVVARRGRIERILVFFGGADNGNVTGRVIAAIAMLQRPDVHVDVVITEAMTHAAAIREQAAGYDNVQVHSGLPTLAHLIAHADLAMGAGGSTSWERLCLGLPALVVTLAENQKPLAQGLHEAGLIVWLGHVDSVDTQALGQALASVMDKGLDAAWSQQCMEAVDGDGLRRVCAALTLDDATAFVTRAVTTADEQLLLHWANDAGTRRNAFFSNPIDAQTHSRWLRAQLQAPESCRFYIVETGAGLPVGQVRFDRSSAGWKINYALGPAFRGRRCGGRLLQAALDRLRQEQPGAAVFGQVKIGNEPSCRVFEALKFAKRDVDTDVVEYFRAL